LIVICRARVHRCAVIQARRKKMSVAQVLSQQIVASPAGMVASKKSNVMWYRRFRDYALGAKTAPSRARAGAVIGTLQRLLAHTGRNRGQPRSSRTVPFVTTFLINPTTSNPEPTRQPRVRFDAKHGVQSRRLQGKATKEKKGSEEINYCTK